METRIYVEDGLLEKHLPALTFGLQESFLLSGIPCKAKVVPWFERSNDVNESFSMTLAAARKYTASNPSDIFSAYISGTNAEITQNGKAINIGVALFIVFQGSKVIEANYIPLTNVTESVVEGFADVTAKIKARWLPGETYPTERRRATKIIDLAYKGTLTAIGLAFEQHGVPKNEME